MLKELFEAHFYITFPKAENRFLNLTEHIQTGSFSLLDKESCRDCLYVCDNTPENREQMKIVSQQTVNYISIDDIFSYVKDGIGERCDYLMEGNNTVAVVEMTCSTANYVTGKRQKARSQLRNTLVHLLADPMVKEHFEQITKLFAVFSWRETFEHNATDDFIGENMTAMTAMSDEVYSPDNESLFYFGFKLKEIRYPYAFVF